MTRGISYFVHMRLLTHVLITGHLPLQRVAVITVVSRESKQGAEIENHGLDLDEKVEIECLQCETEQVKIALDHSR